MKSTLLLNNDFQPLGFISSKKSILLLLKERAEIIDMGNGLSIWDDTFTTPTSLFTIPATIKLKSHVKFRPKTSFKKKVLFNRDNWECQYCGESLTTKNITIDHVKPKFLGGSTSWTNCVAACTSCNSRKGSRLLGDTDMKLRKIPNIPNASHFYSFRTKDEWHGDWSIFFPKCEYLNTC